MLNLYTGYWNVCVYFGGAIRRHNHMEEVKIWNLISHENITDYPTGFHLNVCFRHMFYSKTKRWLSVLTMACDVFHRWLSVSVDCQSHSAQKPSQDDTLVHLKNVTHPLLHRCVPVRSTEWKLQLRLHNIFTSFQRQWRCCSRSRELLRHKQSLLPQRCTSFSDRHPGSRLVWRHLLQSIDVRVAATGIQGEMASTCPQINSGPELTSSHDHSNVFKQRNPAALLFPRWKHIFFLQVSDIIDHEIDVFERQEQEQLVYLKVIWRKRTKVI